MSTMIPPDSSTMVVTPTKDLIAYLTEQDHDVVREIVREFPLAQSKDLVFANLTDEKQRRLIMHDINMALVTSKARLPRNLKTQSDYWNARAMVELRATRAIGPSRDRVLAATQRTETMVTEQPARPRTSIRRVLHL